MVAVENETAVDARTTTSFDQLAHLVMQMIAERVRVGELSNELDTGFDVLVVCGPMSPTRDQLFMLAAQVSQSYPRWRVNLYHIEVCTDDGCQLESMTRLSLVRRLLVHDE